MAQRTLKGLSHVVSPVRVGRTKMWLQCLTVPGSLLTTYKWLLLTHVKTWEVSSVAETWDWKVVFKVDSSNDLHGHGLVFTPKLCPAPGHGSSPPPGTAHSILAGFLQTTPKPVSRRFCPAASSSLGGHKNQTKPSTQQIGKLRTQWTHPRSRSCLGEGRYELRCLTRINYGRLGRVVESPSHLCQLTEPLLSLRTLFVWSM